MSSPKNPEEVLWSIFPLLLIASLLVAGILLLPRINQVNLDDRSRASEPPTVRPTDYRKTDKPEITCSSLYDPVCGSDGITYPNSCEANLAGIKSFTDDACLTDLPISLPTSN